MQRELLVDIPKCCQLDCELLMSFSAPSFPVEGRLLLDIKSLLFTFFFRVLLPGTLLSLAGSTFVEAQAKGDAVFVGLKKTDRVGKTSAQPDGKPDAVFTLSLKPAAGEASISEIEIRTVAGPPGVWSTTRTGPGVSFLGVARAKTPSEIMNPQPEALQINPQQDPHILLLTTDDGHFANKARRYQLKVTASDGTSWSAPIKTEGGSAEEAAPASGVYPVRMSAVLKGISEYDAVNPGKNIAGDDKADGLFVLSIEAKGKVITAVEVRNTDGVKSAWDTVPTSPNGVVGVALSSDPVKLLNNRDGTVAITVQDRTDLNLYVADNGGIEGGKTNYRVSVTFSDGGLSWCPVQRSGAPPQEAKEAVSPGAAKTVNFLPTWKGFFEWDAVGRYPGIKSDGEADTVFGLEIEISPKSEITGIEIQSVDGLTRRWSTQPNSGDWGLAVAFQSAPRALLNKPDGTIRIPVDARTQFYIYGADPGDIATSTQRFRMIVHLADGSSYQQFVRRAGGHYTSSVAPGAEETPKAKGIITCEFRGFIGVDLVNPSTRPGKDGYLDGTFNVKLQVEEKKLARVDIVGANGVVTWSSDPKAPMMFLGVALYPHIYKLVNEKPGLLQLPVSGKKTLYLYAADNGLLSDPKVRLTVVLTFTDKSTLSTEVIR
jgi:hypothetical protein